MPIYMQRVRKWLMLLLGALLAMTCIPIASAQSGNQAPQWVAVAYTADLSTTPFSIHQVVYAGRNPSIPGGNATILKWQDLDITAACVKRGTLPAPDANGYVQFDGATNAIVCDAPGISASWNLMYPTKPLPGEHMSCAGGIAPMYTSADFKLGSGTKANPLFVAPSLGVSSSLPRAGSLARSQLLLGTSVASSDAWTPKVAGNQVLLGGWSGPGIIAGSAQFGWLNYLDPAWANSFRTIMGLDLRHWYQSPNSFTTVGSPPASYTLGTGAHRFYIGYNPADNSYFTGALRKAVIDPGCPIS